MKIIDNIKFWLKNSRPYTIPITTLSFLVIFVYSLCYGGNLFHGLIAYIGISLVHLATNLSDDYFDYKKLVKNPEFCAKDCKCRYLRDGYATMTDLRNTIITMLGIAGVCGAFLFFTSGCYVILFALAILPIAIFYSELSSRGLGDIAVITAYGPLMFGGVYYVMTKSLCTEVFILSFACAIIVETVLYAHMLMDFKDDINAGKTTLCTRLKTPQNALKLLLYLYICAYIFIIITIFISHNYWYLLTIFTIFPVLKLYNSIKLYIKDETVIPPVEIWNYPLNIKKQLPVNASFFHRFYLSINICTIFMLITIWGIILNNLIK